MKDQPLEALISDPAFDPTKWMLRAFKDYISGNPEIVLEDEICRPYLLQALETEYDWNKVFRRLPANPEIVSDALKAFSVTNTSDVGKIVHRNLIKCLIRLSDSDSDERWGNYLLKVPNLAEQPKMVLINQMTSKEIFQGITTWDTSSWQTGFWDLIIRRLDNIELIRLIVWDGFPNAICSPQEVNHYTSTAEIALLRIRIVKFQDILISILVRLRDHTLIEFEDLLDKIESETLENLYCKNKDTKGHLIKDNRIWRPVSEYGYTNMVKTKPKLNKLLCRCGYMCNSSSGLSLHRKGCTYGNAMSVAKVFQLQLARCGGGTELTCRKCGKVCKSKPGYTLHSKKCYTHYSNEDLFKLCWLHFT